jgi:hypothetical protein
MGIKSLLSFILIFLYTQSPFLLPIQKNNRKEISEIQLTEIGKYGILRKSRKNIPAHLHTGIDIIRPNKNYRNEPIFSIAEGIVISKRTDGPYAQLIIEHIIDNKIFWTVYEHIAGIMVNLNDLVSNDRPIARFMNKEELNKYGWQFDHFHLEILKIKPAKLVPDKRFPERRFKSFTLICQDTEELKKYYENPIGFLKENLH